MLFRAEITIPPSLNNIFVNVPGRGRAPSAAYTAWKKTAGWELRAAGIPRLHGSYRLNLQLPTAMRGDVDNRIKAASDLIVSLRGVSDDRHAVSVSAERSDLVPKGRCVLEIESVP